MWCQEETLYEDGLYLVHTIKCFDLDFFLYSLKWAIKTSSSVDVWILKHLNDACAIQRSSEIKGMLWNSVGIMKGNSWDNMKWNYCGKLKTTYKILSVTAIYTCTSEQFPKSTRFRNLQSIAGRDKEKGVKYCWSAHVCVALVGSRQSTQPAAGMWSVVFLGSQSPLKFPDQDAEVSRGCYYILFPPILNFTKF